MPAATQPSAKRREYPVRRPLKRPAVHPGVLMREILEDHLKLAIAESARRMGVSRPALYAVLNGSAAVTAEMALRFARLTGGAPELYLNMQTGYDLEAARERLKETETALPASAVRSGRRVRQAPGQHLRQAPAVSLSDAILRVMQAQGGSATVRDVMNYLTREFGMTVTPSYVRTALKRYHLSGQLENRDEREYLPTAKVDTSARSGGARIKRD
jgi:addiction module HigA family antidote